MLSKRQIFSLFGPNFAVCNKRCISVLTTPLRRGWKRTRPPCFVLGAGFNAHLVRQPHFRSQILTHTRRTKVRLHASAREGVFGVSDVPRAGRDPQWLQCVETAGRAAMRRGFSPAFRSAQGALRGAAPAAGAMGGRLDGQPQVGGPADAGVGIAGRSGPKVNGPIAPRGNAILGRNPASTNALTA